MRKSKRNSGQLISSMNKVELVAVLSGEHNIELESVIVVLFLASFVIGRRSCSFC